MENDRSNPNNQSQVIGVKKHPEDGWAIYYDDNTYRRLKQGPDVITSRIEQLDTPVTAKRRGHKLALAAAALIIGEGVITGASIAQNQGNLAEGLDASANVQIGAFFNSIDALEDFIK